MLNRLQPTLLCLALFACDSGPVSLGSMPDSGMPDPGAGNGGTGGMAGSAGESGSGAGGEGGTGGLPNAAVCGPSICVNGTECCSESCGLCTLSGECSAIECGDPGDMCEPSDCPGPAPLAPSQMCADGSFGGPVCERDDAGDCNWGLRACPDPGSGEPCGGRGSDECPSGEFCKFPIRSMCGAMDAPGLCTSQPSTCPATEDPVCGCDGVTYPNACLASSQGVSVAARGECEGEPTGECGGLGSCGKGEYCEKTSCLARDGQCEPMPGVCDAVLDPVCGCDHKTYSNACEAAAAGMNVASEGECDGGGGGDTCGGFIGAGCAEGEYCDLAAGDGCEVADGQGVCKPMPGICPLNLAPVCGCDGNTYGNACGAAAAGVSVRHDGECK